MSKISDKYLVPCVYLVLVLATLAVFWPVYNYDFIYYDDPVYAGGNLYIRTGISPSSIAWAFTTDRASNWHPLTWLSLMLDYQLFGGNAGGYHITNLLLHIANTLLLFTVLRRMTGGLWQSAFVAALFALHPLHVESVAWIAERKDVLSTLFWFLTMAAYLRYVRRPGASRYLLALLLFALGLMAKPMLVTLPFVLLLLDYWPLERFQLNRNIQWPVVLRLIREKIPFFALSAVSSAVTFFIQQHSGAVATTILVPLNLRIANAPVSFIEYIEKMIWPIQLAVFYPYSSERLLMWRVAVAAVLLLAVSVLVIRFSLRYKYLLVGWLWYLGTLMPVIGLVQVGRQALADRYTYVPLTGLFIIVAWGSNDLLAKWKSRRIVLAVLSSTILLTLSICTCFQLQYWRNNQALFEHALKVTAGNYIAHSLLGYTLRLQGKVDQAIAHDYESLRINPEYAPAHASLGFSLVQQGKFDEAVVHFYEALRLNPHIADVDKGLGDAFRQQGKFEQAAKHFRKALLLKPLDTDIYNKLGIVLGRQGKFDEAVTHFNKALRIKPDLADTHANLGYALAQQGKFDEAIAHLTKAVQLDPNSPNAYRHLASVLTSKGKIDEAVANLKEALLIKPDEVMTMNNLAWLLATHKEAKFYDPQEAIRLAQRACELTKYQQAGIMDTLAAAYAAAGKFSEAVVTAEKALKLAQSSQQKEVTEQIQNRLNLYKASQPYIEPPPK